MGTEKADILVGIASFNNASTIGHVVKAVDAGLLKYFPDKKAIIVNSDGGSRDGTPDIVRTATHDHAAIFLSHPVYPAHRISIPYNGIPGKGSASDITIFSLHPAGLLCPFDPHRGIPLCRIPEQGRVDSSG